MTIGKGKTVNTNWRSTIKCNEHDVYL